MKLKTLKKKIRRLEKRLREGPAKLARLKRNLTALEAKKKEAARVRRAERTAIMSAPPQNKKSRVGTATKGSETTAPTKTKRSLNLSPERRAQLSAAMKARWAAKKASAATTAQTATPTHDSAWPASAQPTEFRPEGM